MIIAILVSIAFSFLYLYKSRTSYYIVVRFYTIIEFSVLIYFFSLYFKNEIAKKIIIYSAFFYFAFCVFDYLKLKAPEMPFIPLSIEHILLLIFITYFFFEVMKESVTEPIYQKAIFWISVAFIINSAGNFFLFIYYSTTELKDDAFDRQYTIIYSTVTIIKNLLLCISILIKETPKNESDKLSFDVDLDSFNPSKNQH